MTKEEVKMYAAKYRRVQKILAVVITTFIILTACVLIGLSILLITKDQDIITIILVAVMAGLSVVDIMLGIRFIKMARNKIKYTKDIECARNYCRIHGIVPQQNKKIEVEKKEEK